MEKYFSFNDIVSRRFKDSDTNELVSLINEAYSYQDHVKGESRTNSTHLRKRATEVELYVFKKEDRLIGCVYTEPQGSSLHFGLLTLVSGHRGTGLAQAIMKAIEEYAKDTEFTTLELDYMSLAPWLKLYYEKYGFVETGEVEPWGKIDLVRMKKALAKRPINSVLKSLNLSPDDTVVIGSGILQALGIRESSDIDLVVTHEVFGTLKSSGEFESKQAYEREILVKDQFEIMTKWNVLNKNWYFADLASESLVIDGVRYISLDFLRRAKQSWIDNNEGRPKDFRDIEMIRKYREKPRPEGRESSRAGDYMDGASPRDTPSVRP